MKYVVIGFACLFISTLCFAGVTRTTYVVGKVWSYDSTTFMICDKQKRLWRIPKSVLKKNFELQPDLMVTVELERSDLKFVRMAD